MGVRKEVKPGMTVNEAKSIFPKLVELRDKGELPSLISPREAEAVRVIASENRDKPGSKKYKDAAEIQVRTRVRKSTIDLEEVYRDLCRQYQDGTLDDRRGRDEHWSDVELAAFKKVFDETKVGSESQRRRLAWEVYYRLEYPHNC